MLIFAVLSLTFNLTDKLPTINYRIARSKDVRSYEFLILTLEFVSSKVSNATLKSKVKSQKRKSKSFKLRGFQVF